MTKKTKSEGKLLTEANNINKSLMVLGYCIAQLSSQKKTDRGAHIPYRLVPIPLMIVYLLLHSFISHC